MRFDLGDDVKISGSCATLARIAAARNAYALAVASARLDTKLERFALHPGRSRTLNVQANRSSADCGPEGNLRLVFDISARHRSLRLSTSAEAAEDSREYVAEIAGTATGAP